MKGSGNKNEMIFPFGLVKVIGNFVWDVEFITLPKVVNKWFAITPETYGRGFHNLFSNLLVEKLYSFLLLKYTILDFCVILKSSSSV